MWAFFLLVVFVVVFFSALNPLQKVECLRARRVEVTPHAMAGATVRLRCEFDLENDELYSVKWYLSQYEFYRYQPNDVPKIQVYSVPGINVDLEASNDKVVTLKNVSMSSSGIYRCEVSAEAPSFNTITVEGEMTIIVTPEQPEITGVKVNYEIGHLVNVNCTSRKSNPAAMLSWTIDHNKAPRKYLQEFPVFMDENGLATTTLGLQFKIGEEFNVQREIKLRCTSTIAPIYYMSVEESIVIGKSLASVLESKETPIQVRADQQNGDCAVTATWWITATLSLVVKVLEHFE